MENQEREEPMRELVEAGMAFRMVQEKAGKVQGWLRTVRHAVGIPVAEVARRMGVGGSEVYRMEYAEGRGVIELQTLRRAAEALGCDLVYGLSPRGGRLGSSRRPWRGRAGRWGAVLCSGCRLGRRRWRR